MKGPLGPRGYAAMGLWGEGALGPGTRNGSPSNRHILHTSTNEKLSNGLEGLGGLGVMGLWGEGSLVQCVVIESPKDRPTSCTTTNEELPYES
jgi:hypothetical protein